MKITKRQLRRIIKEEQMTLNQSGVDAVLEMAEQIEPMFQILRKTAGQTDISGDPLYEQLEEILLDLPFQLEEIAKKMKAQGVEGGIRSEVLRKRLKRIIREEYDSGYPSPSFTPEEENVQTQIESLVEAIEAMGSSNPEMTDDYVYLFRALKAAGVSVDAIARLT